MLKEDPQASLRPLALVDWRAVSTQSITDHINVRGTDPVLACEFTNWDAAFLLSLEHLPELDEFLAAASNALGWRCPVG